MLAALGRRGRSFPFVVSSHLCSATALKILPPEYWRQPRFYETSLVDGREGGSGVVAIHQFPSRRRPVIAFGTGEEPRRDFKTLARHFGFVKGREEFLSPWPCADGGGERLFFRGKEFVGRWFLGFSPARGIGRVSRANSRRGARNCEVS